MNVHLDDARNIVFQKTAALVSYLLSGGLVVGDLLEILDRYAGAWGVIIGAITCATNIYFHLKNREKGDDQ